MDQKLRIAQVAPLWIPVPPITYGGTELVIANLADGLVAKGHDVTLYASGDSKTKARLVPAWEKSLWRAHLASPHAVIGWQMGGVVEDAANFDVIHNHAEFYLAPFSKFMNHPVVSTIHRPIDVATRRLFKRYAEWNRYVAVSYDQMNSVPDIEFAKVIYNGIDVARYAYNEHPQDYLLWLSKIEPEKGVLEAIEVARRAKEKLVIAGNIVAEESGRFFQYEVLPKLDGDQINYVGQVNFERKVELFKNAKALICPISRREPFGLVIVEAMACGTPVIAYDRGAMPELIQNGRNGFVVETLEEMVAAVRAIPRLRRANCRKAVEESFTAERMVNEYEELYRTLIG